MMFSQYKALIVIDGKRRDEGILGQNNRARLTLPTVLTADRETPQHKDSFMPPTASDLHGGIRNGRGNKGWWDEPADY